MAALSIDLLLPAFADMREEFGLAEDSAAPARLITAFFVGLALGQVVYGPMSDRYGRKPLLYAGLVIYVAGAVAAVFMPTLGAVVVCRVVWGFGAAAPRSLALAMVRDRYEGEQMATTMSHVMATFILVPVVAPALGAAAMLRRAVARRVLDARRRCGAVDAVAPATARDTPAGAPPVDLAAVVVGRAPRRPLDAPDTRVRHRTHVPLRDDDVVHRQRGDHHRRRVRPARSLPVDLRVDRLRARRRDHPRRQAGRTDGARPARPVRRDVRGRRSDSASPRCVVLTDGRPPLWAVHDRGRTRAPRRHRTRARCATPPR